MRISDSSSDVCSSDLFAYDTIDYEIEAPAPTPPSWRHVMGTDTQARAVFALTLYGFRLSVTFGLFLLLLSSTIGVVAGAIQGYFGGWIDIVFPRVRSEARRVGDGGVRAGRARG